MCGVTVGNTQMLVVVNYLGNLGNLEVLVRAILMQAISLLALDDQIDLEVTQFGQFPALFDQILFALAFNCLPSPDIFDPFFFSWCWLLHYECIIKY